MFKFFETIKLKFSNQQENCPNKKFFIKDSNQCWSISGDGNVIAGRDINLTKKITNAMHYKKIWNTFAETLSDDRVSYMIKNVFNYPGNLVNKKEIIQDWKNNINNTSEKIPVDYQDPRAKKLSQIVEEAIKAIDSYSKNHNEEDLRQKFTSLFNSLSEIRGF